MIRHWIERSRALRRAGVVVCRILQPVGIVGTGLCRFIVMPVTDAAADAAQSSCSACRARRNA